MTNYAFRGCINLVGAYFEGDAPVFASSAYENCPGVIVFHRAASTGWGATVGGRPTALWIEPPLYSEWLQSSDLPLEHPNASAEPDDPDHDLLSNYAEMLAGTDPTDWTSLLILDQGPRPGDLTAEDLTPIGDGEHALYIRSVPGKTYAVQWAEAMNGPWHVDAVVTATTTQKRFVFPKPAVQAFYRVILAQ